MDQVEILQRTQSDVKVRAKSRFNTHTHTKVIIIYMSAMKRSVLVLAHVTYKPLCDIGGASPSSPRDVKVLNIYRTAQNSQ